MRFIPNVYEELSGFLFVESLQVRREVVFPVSRDTFPKKAIVRVFSTTSSATEILEAVGLDD